MIIFFKIIKSGLWEFPCPGNLNIWWTFGSMRGICLIIQIISGLLLAIHYSASIEHSFYSISHIIKEVNYGWIIRNFHVSGASIFFFCVYIHIARRIYYGNYENIKVWNSGIIILFTLIAIAFIGYVLPWGQISFWGCTVITNLFSAVPFLGKDLVFILWGGPSVRDYTLKRFFILHFILPFLLAVLSFFHLVFLHENGSSNPLGIRSSSISVSFYPFYLWIDICGFCFIFFIIFFIVFFYPYILNVPENWSLANPLVTPVHIKPEWYFLWLYAILRSIPFKLGGILTIVFAILFLFFLPFLSSLQIFKGFIFYPIGQIFFWILLSIILCLTWIGGCPVEYPYEFLGRIFTFFYFFFILFLYLIYYEIIYYL